MEFATNLPDTANDYWIKFNEYVSKIQSSLAETGETTLEQLAATKLEITALQGYATNSTNVLPKYDIRRSQEVSCVLFF